MPYWILTFFFGICALLTCSKLPSLYWLLILIPVFICWFFAPQKIKNIIKQVLVFLLGFCWCLLYVHWLVSWSLPQNLENKNILITGCVADTPINRSHSVSFKFKTRNIGKEKVKTNLNLSWYGFHPKINAGEKWQLLVRLKRPRGNANPGSFDVEKHSLVNHIRARGYVVKSNSNRLLSSHLYNHPFSRLRQILIDRTSHVLADNKFSSIVIALVTGSKNSISKDQWQVIRDTGIGHLIAISGLHVGLAAGVFFVLISFFWRRSYKLTLLMPAGDAGIIASLFAALIYSLISGFSVPAERALVMLCVFSLMLLLRRNVSPWSALLCSLFIVLFINPLSPLTVGFWMSFAAVFVIIYVNVGRLGQKTSYLNKFWRMQLSISVVLLPFSLLFFQQFSLVSFLANLVAMPVMCLFVIPLSLFGVLFLLISETLGGWILWCSVKFLQVIWWWLEFLVDSFGCNWYHVVYNWWIMLAAIVGSLILLAPRGFPARFIGLLWFLPMFFYVPPKPVANKEFWVSLLDVGQGLAVLVQTKNHVLVYDSGPKFFASDAGVRIIVPYLRLAGIRSIDTMVISHGDSDHAGGAKSILNVFPVKSLLMGGSGDFLPNAKSCIAGQNWQWDGVNFHMLSPGKDSSFVGNDASCVLKVESDNGSLLLPGDIEYSAENLLVENHGKILRSDLLVAPHHGSSTSSTYEFIKKVQPQYVIFPVGYRNRFRFPHKRVISRYVKIGAKLFNTAKTGAITFKFANKSDILRVNSYREDRKHFWDGI